MLDIIRIEAPTAKLDTQEKYDAFKILTFLAIMPS